MGEPQTQASASEQMQGVSAVLEADTPDLGALAAFAAQASASNTVAAPAAAASVQVTPQRNPGVAESPGNLELFGSEVVLSGNLQLFGSPPAAGSTPPSRPRQACTRINYTVENVVC